MPLAERHCVPCEGGVPKLDAERIRTLLAEIPGWEAPENHHLHRLFRFPDFKEGLDFVNRTGEIAEREGHHPDLLLAWGKVEVTIFTHSIDGLSENDFVLAAKLGQLYTK